MLRHRVPGLRSIAVLLASTLGAVPLGLASAAPSPAAAEPAADPLAEAQQLYERGRTKFDTADYRAAIELWTEAYAKVPDTADGGQIRVLLIYNIATARERAFDVSRDPAELRQARILLVNFEQSIATLYGEGPEADAERERVQTKLAEIDEQLARFDHPQDPDDGRNDDGGNDGGDGSIEPEPVVDDPPSDGAAKGLVIGGAVSLSLGVGGLAMMAAGLGIGAGANDISGLADDDVDGRRDQFARGRTGNTLAIAGGVAGGVLVATGAVLLAIGLKRKRSSTVALGPLLGPQGPGLVLRGRF